MSFGKLQINVLERIKKDYENFGKADSARLRRANYIQTRISILDEQMVQANKYHENIMVDDGKIDSEQVCVLVQTFDKIRELFADYKADLLDALDKIPVIKPATNGSSASQVTADTKERGHNELRLPVINIPTFSGSYETWRSFHDMFVALIHNNQSLSDVQKLHYLKSSVSGEADRLLQHLAIDQSNYGPAWKILTERYDHKRVLVNTQLKLLFNQHAITSDSSANIKRILDTSQEIIHALKNLGLPVDSWDVILIFIILQKLSNNTQQLWEEELGSSKELPSFKEFVEFLECRFRTLEAVDPRGSSSKSEQRRSGTSNVFYSQEETRKQVSCSVCQRGQHSLRNCDRFLQMDVERRKQTVRRVKVCENCLAYSHFKQRCPSAKCCHFCKQRHHSLLHENTRSMGRATHGAPSATQFAPHPSTSSHTNNHQPHQTSTVSPNASEFQPHTSNNTHLNSYHVNTNNKVLLATALLRVRSSGEGSKVLRALVDPGSEASFITESAVQRLGLKPKRTFMKVNGLGLVSSGTTQKAVDLELESLTSSYTGKAQALVFRTLTGLLPAQYIDCSKWNSIRGLALADPTFNIPSEVDMLLGGDIYSDILLSEVIKVARNSSPVAQKTQLGWILLGKIPSSVQVSSFSCQLDSTIDTTLRKFWEIEEEPFPRYEAEEEKECEAHFRRNTIRLPGGRYQVCLPFKGGKHPTMGPTRHGALKRFLQLERRLHCNPTLLHEYSNTMQEYLTLGHMSPVNESDYVLQTPHHYFIPHHAVIKESSTTTKLRVVFDATFKTIGGASLNDHLMIGPKMQKNVIDIIMRWRLYKYTFTGDVEKMYRQIQVSSQDSHYQHILWREHPEDEIKMFRLRTVTFGTASAPYLAIRVFQQLAEDEAHRFPSAAQVLKEETYVDDVISGADNIEEAQEKLKAVKELLETAGFHLRKHVSNSNLVLQHIPMDQRGINFSIPFDESANVKTLGIRWLPALDAFSFQVATISTEDITKRSILSSIARLYDPMGWVSPCIIKAKMIMQQLWWKGSEWDKPLPPELVNEWLSFSKDLPNIERIHIPRWINTSKQIKMVEIHGFSDASEKAYAAAVYLRVLGEDDRVHMRLLLSKTKVAPLKPITLPRLELCGAMLLARLLTETGRILKLDKAKMVAWTDSLITLCWIKAHPSKWKTFVCNRVSQIQRLTSCAIWKHIPSQLNPADLASRGIHAENLVDNELWWQGPEFLRHRWDAPLPEQPHVQETQQEERPTRVHHQILEEGVVEALLHKHSTLSRVTRIVGYCLRFLGNKQQHHRPLNVVLSPQELETALMKIIRAAQERMFPEKFKETNTHEFRGLKALNPFKDEQGVLRVGGRLRDAHLPFNTKHPILLRHKHPLVHLIIKEAHEKTLHGSNQRVMAYIRQRFWIFRLKTTVKNFIFKCNICYRFRAKPLEQLMGSLPTARTTISRPFTYTGVDYAGPVEVKTWRGRNAKQYKGYFALFVCMATKAIHIELVSDMTTQAFIAAFRRFVSRRGLCRELFSDCGKNFIGADNELHKCLQASKIEWKTIANSLANDGTKWNFIPPASPHFGGLWEAGVKSVKFHIKRVAGNSTLTFEELTTLLTQIEACLNSRPLCPQSDDVNDLQPITPGHFLIGSPLVSPPQPHYDLVKMSHLERWKRVQALLQSFWRCWSSEYLSRLQQRPKWMKTIHDQIKEGDLVLVKDERLPPLKWNMARIKQLHPGPDGLVRVVTLKTETAELKRPITKICPLPSNTSNADTTHI